MRTSVFNRARALALTLALGLGAVSTPAFAQAEPTEGQKETARGLMKSGRDKEKAGRYEDALADYQAADAIMQVPSTSVSVGEMLVRLGRLVEARTALLRAARYPIDSGSPDALREARDKAASLAEELGERIPSLTIVIQGVEGSRVTVQVDGEAVAPALVGRPLKLNPGVHAVRVLQRDRVLAEREVTLVERGSESLEVPIDPTTLAPDPDPVPSPSPDPLPLPDPRPDPTQGDEGLPAPAWVGIALGGAGLVVGAAAGIVALVRTSELDDACPDQRCAADQQGAWDDANLAAHVSTGGFVAAGVGAAILVVTLIVAASSDTAVAEPLTWRF
jgi:hypothetical protein